MSYSTVRMVPHYAPVRAMTTLAPSRTIQAHNQPAHAMTTLAPTSNLVAKLPLARAATTIATGEAMKPPHRRRDRRGRRHGMGTDVGPPLMQPSPIQFTTDPGAYIDQSQPQPVDTGVPMTPIAPVTSTMPSEMPVAPPPFMPSTPLIPMGPTDQKGPTALPPMPGRAAQNVGKSSGLLGFSWTTWLVGAGLVAIMAGAGMSGYGAGRLTTNKGRRRRPRKNGEPKYSFTKAETEDAFKRLEWALKAYKLPSTYGVRNADADEFMLMHGEDERLYFKHKPSRNYIILGWANTITVPSGGMFAQGVFDKNPSGRRGRPRKKAKRGSKNPKPLKMSWGPAIDYDTRLALGLPVHGGKRGSRKPKKNTGSKTPAAACPRCGGWTSYGGMSQYSASRVPVLGRTGCTCTTKKRGSRKPKKNAGSRFDLGDHVMSYIGAGKIVDIRRDPLSGWKYHVEADDGFHRWINEASLRKKAKRGSRKSKAR